MTADGTVRAAVVASGAEPALVVCVVLVFPIVLFVGHHAPLGRTLYPATNLAVAAWLFVRKSPWFAGQCVLLFCFVSLVRRLIDAQAGFDPSNPVLLTPYLCCALTSVSFLAYWSRTQPTHLGLFLILLACTVYGWLLAVLQGLTLAGTADLLKWTVGPLFAVHILAHRDSLPSVRRTVESCLVWGGVAMAGYGLFQYISPPAWDAEWMQGVAQLGMTSIGQPEPFAVRVFSTMNSPGSLGAILCAAIVVTSKRKLPVAIPAISLMLIALALCQYRTLWAATAVAAVMIVLARPAVLNPTNILAVLGVIAALSVTAMVPDMREAISQRASSLTALQTDESLEERLGQYRALARDEDLIAGVGLGQNGIVRKLDGLAPTAIDSGLVDIWRSLGVAAGTVFLLAIAALVALLFTRPATDLYHLAFDRAIAVTAFAQLPMGSSHIGELGFCGWLFLALGLAALAPTAALQHSTFVRSQ